jgi:hypothetical protein
LHGCSDIEEIRGQGQVTAGHYAKWIGGDVYRAPLQLRDGDVPADFIARFAYESPQSHLTKKAVGDQELLSHRPLLRKLVELRGIEPLTLRLPERSAVS